jgi:adenine phosphoribosyltransferase
VNTGGVHTTVNEFTDQQPALRPEVLAEACNRLCQAGVFHGDKLLTEEDKGAILAGVVAMRTGLPLAVARWYPYGLGEHGGSVVPLSCEYFTGTLYLNGIDPGDQVVLIEDTISTGGTIIALIDAVRQARAEVVEVLAVVEKVDNRGVERVLSRTGVAVKTLLKIRVDERTKRVLVVQ